MNSFINYIIESGISLGLLSLIYFVFLRNETFFKANRLFLLFAVVFSSALPLLHLKVYGPANLLLPTNEGGTNMLEAVTVNGTAFSRSLTDLITANQLFLFGYLAISAIFTMLLVYKIYQVARMVRKGKLVRKAGINFVYVEGNSSPYSFLSYLFVSENLENNPNWEKMLAHESEHIRQGHTVDILILELVSIFQWFNPFFWLLRRVIKENHEYMADRAVLNKGVAVKQYKEILVTQFIGNQFAMANNFNSSLIKSRLKMMTKIKSSNKAKFRYLIGGVMAIALVLVFACENKESTVEQIKGPEKGVALKSASGEQPLILIDGEMADKDAMEKLNPADIQSVNVKKTDLDAFVEKYGDLAKNGVIDILLKTGAADVKKSYDGELHGSDPDVFFIVDELPVFPGGESALRKFISNSIVYPEEAKKAGIQGKVYVNFVVEKDGSIGRAKVVRGVAPSLDAEALRVMKASPQWTPGKHKGEFVAVSYTVPISFVLQ